MSIELQLEKCNTAFRIFRQINDSSKDEYNYDEYDDTHDWENQPPRRRGPARVRLEERLEASALACVDAATLAEWIARAPQEFTPWFLHELAQRPGLGNFAAGMNGHHEPREND